MKLRELTKACQKSECKRLLCSDLVQLVWTEPNGAKHREIVVLENLSRAGAELFMGVAVPKGMKVRLIANDLHLAGQVKQCVFRENGYIVSLELDSGSNWAQEAGTEFLPEHLLDVSLPDLE